MIEKLENNNELITVGIALYNNQNYIKRCVNSVINQSYQNIEILIVDDGSNDNSLEVVSSIVDHRIRIIKKENNGLSSVRQKCLELSKGKYICFIDGDDYIKTDYIEKLYRAVTSNKCDIAICGTIFLKDNEEEITDSSDAYSFFKQKYTEISISDLQNCYCNLLNEFYMSDSWNKMYRKDFLINNNLNFKLSKGYNGTDLIFNHKVLLYSPKIVTITDRLYIHMIYEKSATHRKGKNLLKSMLVAIEQIVLESKRLDIFPLIRNQIANLFYLLIRNAIQDLYTDSNGKRKKFYEALNLAYIEIDDFQNRIIKMRIEHSISKSLLLFSAILSAHNRTLTYVYFCIRDKFEKVV